MSFATHHISRTAWAMSVAVILVFASIVPGFAVFQHLWPPRPMLAPELLLFDLFAVVYALVCLGRSATILLLTPNGSWRIDADGVSFRPRRGPARSIGWHEIERVKWPPDGRVVLRHGRFSLPIDLSQVDEPARSQAIARLEAKLRPNFDLSRRPIPDRLNTVEPAWLNWTLRIARALLVSLVVGVTFAASLWLVAMRYPKAGAWQPQYLALCWFFLLLVVMVRFAVVQARLNPTWRVRLTKKPPTDPWETW